MLPTLLNGPVQTNSLKFQSISHCRILLSVGSIDIMGKRVWVDREAMTDNGDGTYGYVWDTGDVPGGKYFIDVTLEEADSGRADSDGLVPGIDLEITIADRSPPEVVEVSAVGSSGQDTFQAGDLVTVKVVEGSGERDLIGTIDVLGSTKELKNQPLIDFARTGFSIYNLCLS